MKKKTISADVSLSVCWFLSCLVLCLRKHTHSIQHLSLYYAVIAVLINYGCVDPGFLFRQPDCAAVAVNYSKKCWEVYQAYCKVNAAPRDDQTMTCRQLLWMFKVQRTVAPTLPCVLTASYSFWLEERMKKIQQTFTNIQLASKWSALFFVK